MLGLRAVMTVGVAMAVGSIVSFGCRKATPPTVSEDSGGAASEEAELSPSASVPPVVCAGSCRAHALAPLRHTDQYAVAADGKHVYFAATYAMSVARIAVSGGPRTILVPGPPNPSQGGKPAAQLALSDTHVYWVNDDRRVQAMPKDGGPSTVVFEDPRLVRNLAVDMGRVWWTTMPDPATGAGFEHPATQPYVLGEKGPYALGKPLEAWLTLDLDARATIFIDDKTHELVELAHATGKRTVLARDVKNARVAGHDLASVVLVEGNVITRVPRKELGERETLFAVKAGEELHGVVVEAGEVWIVLFHTLVRVPLAGGPPRVHEDWSPNWADDYFRPVTDAGAIYLALRTGGGKRAPRVLVRVPK